MNRDFLISGNPSKARMVMRLARISNIHVDPAISEIAETGLISDSSFEGMALSPSERAAVQSVMDFEFRAIIPGNRNVTVALVAAKIANISPIFIVGPKNRERYWSTMHEAFGLEKFTFIQSSKVPDPDIIRNQRHGLLLVDDQAPFESDAVRILVKDFQKTIFLSNRKIISDLTESIILLSPHAPHEILTTVNAFFKQDNLIKKGFKTSRPEELAFMLNVITDLMSITVDQVKNPDEYNNLERDLPLGHMRLDY